MTATSDDEAGFSAGSARFEMSDQSDSFDPGYFIASLGFAGKPVTPREASNW